MTEKKVQGSYMKYMANPKGFTMKKWFAELLKDKYPPFEAIIERVSAALVTDKDLQEFGKIITTVFEAGYFKAVNDYKGQCEKLGIKVSVVAEEPSPKNPD